MSRLTLTPTALREGIWQGHLTQSGSETPQIEATYQGQPVLDVKLEALDDKTNEWTLKIPVPGEAISDGVQLIVISDGATGDRIGQITLIAGDTADEDVRAEVELLRAELDTLKRAFRRHCRES